MRQNLSSQGWQSGVKFGVICSDGVKGAKSWTAKGGNMMEGFGCNLF